MKLAGWGRFPVHDCRVSAPRTESALTALLSEGGVIARGNGRAYGDSAIGHRNTVWMRHFNRMIAFDTGTGQMVAESGVLLADIISAFLPRGWFPAVTPGTKFVTLGGMIAADVHGKNHHRDSSFGSFIDWIDLVGSDGRIRRCSRHENRELFDWTIGGMGLTGIVLRAAFRLRPVETSWIKQTTLPARNLDAAIDALERAQDATYSVAWIDCLSTGENLGRSLVILGEHAVRSDLPERRRSVPYAAAHRRTVSIPFDMPAGVLNRVAVRLFNQLYYWNGTRRAGTTLVHWDEYFYPLDAISNWNRMYGRKGFSQFQCVLPLDRSKAGVRALLEATSRAGAGSFLAVLKRFGAQDSKFSFPMLGYTLALDFPMTSRTLALMEMLDRIAIEHAGRFYLAKDSRMTADTLRQSDARSLHFVQMRDEMGLRNTFRSRQAERLAL
jgi:decaprenylphospho-beta-D-ribofuranose 2-oxidase